MGNRKRRTCVKCHKRYSLEVFKDEKWVKAYKSIEDFEKNIDEKLIEKSIYYSMLIN